MNNFEKTLKNSTVLAITQIAILILSFVNRKVFTIFLDIELLGYQSLFSNVFSILSVAELGIGNIISVNLYKELARDDNVGKEEQAKLMYLYKSVYSCIGIFVLIVGTAIYFFLPYIVSDSTLSKGYLTIIYFLQLFSVFIDYFFSYRRTIYIADQKEYVCASIDIKTKLIIQITQIVALAVFKNYIIYLIIQLSSNLIANFIIYNKSNRDYPYLNIKISITREYISSKNFIKEIKNFMIHKVAFALYGSTDNIIISSILGVRYVALYGNYYLLFNGVVVLLFNKILNSFQATIGKIINSDRKLGDIWSQFLVLDTLSFFLASFLGAGFIVFFQPTISIWLGEEYLLSVAFMIMFSLTIYLNTDFEMLNKYRASFGEFHRDKNTMLLGAFVNLVLSIALSNKLGLIGIQIGTIVGYFFIEYGRIKFVIKDYFGESILRYLLKHFIFSLIAISEMFLCYILTKGISYSFSGFLIRGIVVLVIPQLINYIIFRSTEEMRNIMLYTDRILNLIRRKKH